MSERLKCTSCGMEMRPIDIGGLRDNSWYCDKLTCLSQMKDDIQEVKLKEVCLKDLAEQIASLPQGHDELEVLIGDLIKRQIHQEKYFVYQFLYHMTKHLEDEKVTGMLVTKMGTHKNLANTWEYGTKNSVIHQGGWVDKCTWSKENQMNVLGE